MVFQGPDRYPADTTGADRPILGTEVVVFLAIFATGLLGVLVVGTLGSFTAVSQGKPLGVSMLVVKRVVKVTPKLLTARLGLCRMKSRRFCRQGGGPPRASVGCGCLVGGHENSAGKQVALQYT